MATVTTTKSTGVGSDNSNKSAIADKFSNASTKSSTNNSLFGNLSNDLQNFVSSSFGNLTAPTIPQVSSYEENLKAANNAARNAANDSYSIQASAARLGSQLGTEAYAEKMKQDGYKAQKESDIRIAETKALTPITFVTDKTKYDISGRNLADVANQQDAQARQREQFQQQLTLADRDRYNQQLLAGTAYQNQSALTRAQQVSAEKIAALSSGAQVAAAGLSAQGGILSSLFGSIGSGSPNYRYWS